MNPGADTFQFDFEGEDEFESVQPIVLPEIYQQNESLEPDGAVLKRTIIDYFHVAVISGNTSNAGTGIFFDHAVLVHDVNADLTAVLSTANWSDTMIKERVLWYDSHDYAMAAPVPNGAGTSNFVVHSESLDLVALPHFRVDFRVAAKLAQNKQVSFLTRVSIVGMQGGTTAAGNVRMQARALIGGRF